MAPADWNWALCAFRRPELRWEKQRSLSSDDVIVVVVSSRSSALGRASGVGDAPRGGAVRAVVSVGNLGQVN